MTLTTLSSKEFKTLFKWAFKRNRVIMIIFSICLAVGLILNIYALAIDGGSYDDDAAPITIAVYEIGAAFFTFVSALKTFSFLHNKRSVDMFGALPASRGTMFAAHLFAGISSVMIPFTIGSIIITGVASRSGKNFKLCVFMIFTALIMIAASYTFTALVAYCCGTVIDTAIVTIAANGIYVGIIVLYYAIVSEIIPGFDFESLFDSPLFTALAPYSFSLYSFSLIETVFYANNEAMTLTTVATIIWQLIFTAGIFFLTAFVATKRKAESSQNGFAFNWLPMVIKAGASIVAGGFIGFIAAETAGSGYTNMYIFAFWYIIIAFVAFFVLHVIFSRGLKGKFIPQAIVFGSTSAAVLIIVFSLTYGLGIDTYVPNPDTVKSVRFDYVDYYEPENIKTVTEIHQLITEGLRNEYDYPYFLGDNYNEDLSYQSAYYDYTEGRHLDKYEYVNSANFDIEYSRKIGTSVSRDYWFSGYKSSSEAKYYDFAKMDELIKKLRSSEEYKQYKYPEIWDENYRIDNKIEVTAAKLNYEVYIDENYNYTTASYAALPTDDEFINGLCEALKKDIIADDNFNADWSYSKEVFGTEFIEVEITFDKFRHTYREYTQRTTIPVKNSYKNTHDFLAKQDIEKKPLQSFTGEGFTGEDYENRFYYDDYINFGFSGDYGTLINLINELMPSWEASSCHEVGLADYSDWHGEHYTDYANAMLQKTYTLYNEYSNDNQYFDINYTNQYIYEAQDFGEYFQLEDTIINELIEYSDEFVKSTVTKEDDSKGSTSSASESGTASEKNKDSENTKSDIDSNTQPESEIKSISENVSDSDKAASSKTVSELASASTAA